MLKFDLTSKINDKPNKVNRTSKQQNLTAYSYILSYNKLMYGNNLQVCYNSKAKSVQ